jgi:hypothetical protein
LVFGFWEKVPIPHRIDAKAVLGLASLEVKVFDAGHEAPVTHVVDFVWKGWEAAR